MTSLPIHLHSFNRNNAVAFDSEKTEVIQFPGRRRETAAVVNVNGTPVEPAEHIRWLGVHLDPRLNFQHHVTQWCGNAMKVAQHMRRFNSAYRGAAPMPLVRAVDACIVPVATFGSDVWWPGLKRPTLRGISTPSTTNMRSMIDKAILMGLRAALPVMRTTPNVVLHREAGIPPAKILLEGNRIRVAARLKSLNKQHPWRSRASVCPNAGTQKHKKKKKGTARPELQMSRVQRAFQQLPESEAPDIIPTPIYVPALGTRETETEACTRWIKNVPGREICAYADGSSEGHGRSAWGFVLKREGTTFFRGSAIPHGGEVLDAEIIGAKNALEAALSFVEEEQRKFGDTKQRIHVLLDSQQAVKILITGTSSSSLKDVRSFHALSKTAEVFVKWVPGHSGIQGNVEADSIARSALRGLPNLEIKPGLLTLAYLRRLMNQRQQALLDNWWEEACPSRYRELDLLMRRRKPPELALSRRLLRELIAARTGHGNFAAYYRRFQFSDAPTECTCGEETTPTLFIHYRLHTNITRKLRKSMSHNDFINKLLGPKSLRSFTIFAQETGCFNSQTAGQSTALSGDRIN